MLQRIKDRLNDPHTAHALAIIFGLAGTLVPARYQLYLDAVAAVLVAFGWVAPNSINAKIEKLAQANDLANPLDKKK